MHVGREVAPEVGAARPRLKIPGGPAAGRPEFGTQLGYGVREGHIAHVRLLR